MDRRILAAIVVVLAIVAVGYVGMSIVRGKRASSAREANAREWAAAEYSQEIICDDCGAVTTGLSLNRAQASSFQKCPKCGAMAGRPVVYYMCQNPGCNRQLIAARHAVWTDAGQSLGDRVVCPNCGQTGPNISPDFLPLKSAQRVANETGQEFP